MKLVVWNGSGSPDALEFQRQYRHLADAWGDSLTLVGASSKPSVVVRGSCAEEALAFARIMREANQLILCVGGGTGASRILHRLFDLEPAQEMACKSPSNIVIGASDSSVYVAAAHLFFGAKGFYAINLMEPIKRVLSVLEKVQEPSTHARVYRQVTELIGGLSSDPYTLFPVCARPFTSVKGRFERRALRYLATHPCLFMVEDAYPQDDLNWIGFYEDLTRLLPFFEATAAGGGALAFGPVPGLCETPTGLRYGPKLETDLLIREALASVNVAIPTFSGVRFGHHVRKPHAIGFGTQVVLEYRPTQSDLVFKS